MNRKALKYSSRKEETASALSRLSTVCNMAILYAVLPSSRNGFFDSAGSGFCQAFPQTIAPSPRLLNPGATQAALCLEAQFLCA